MFFYQYSITNLLKLLKPFQNAKFEKITEILTELDSNMQNGLLKLKVAEAKEVPLILRMHFVV